MNRTLKKIHRWLGFPIGIIFLITFGTGLITAISELVSRDLVSRDLVSRDLISNDLASTVPASSDLASNTKSDYQQDIGLDVSDEKTAFIQNTLMKNAQDLTRITDRHKEIRQIIMPSNTAPFYKVIKRGEVWIYSANDLRELSYYKTQSNPFFDTMLQLHRNLLLGNKGEIGFKGASFVAWISLIALAISCLGLYLWWPMRKTFKTKHLLPKNTKRHSFYYTHMTAGVVTFLLILLMSVTGASITYREITQSLLGIDKTQQLSDSQIQLPRIENNWLSRLTATNQLMPDGQLTDIRFYKPRKKTNTNKAISKTDNSIKSKAESKIISFRFSTQADWLGLPSSYIRIDSHSSELISLKQFKQLSTGEKIMSVIKPLHTGRGLHWGYVLVLLLMSALGVLMRRFKPEVHQSLGIQFSSIYPHHFIWGFKIERFSWSFV
jgi:hypothetical protein